MNYQQLQNQITDLTTEINAKETARLELEKQLIPLAVADLFKKHPNLVSFDWFFEERSEYDDQGGSDIYREHLLQIIKTSDDEWDVEGSEVSEWDWYKTYVKDDKDIKRGELAFEIWKVLDGFSEKACLEEFGYDAALRADRTGIEKR